MPRTTELKKGVMAAAAASAAALVGAVAALLLATMTTMMTMAQPRLAGVVEAPVVGQAAVVAVRALRSARGLGWWSGRCRARAALHWSSAEGAVRMIASCSGGLTRAPNDRPGQRLRNQRLLPRQFLWQKHLKEHQWKI